ncbi:MalY/PatB family protein [Streptomyces turgidiscabies]|uniref:cysteine-S-conjugate beta-lyase n=1 Tax=Streptomyces turgidiscabies TaxID=85558 RepID=A0ABU0RWG5_9ACTN|nr:MalY/PatB family protein [Streptomyces turgidiscabies]MDQ0936301.1 cystathionine beta-lyase [Streptomyces turgidiscabies]
MTDATKGEAPEVSYVSEADRTDPLVQLSLEQLRRRTSLKWRAHPADVLPLWVAEMDVPMAPPVAEALRAAIDLGDTGYPCGSAYAEALAGFAAERWRWDGLRVEHTAIVPDVMLGVVEVLRLVTGPGDAVVVCSPVYPPFYAFVAHDAREIVEARLGPDLRVDLAALEDAFVRARRDGRRAAFLMSNPHNPTGVVHTRQELEAVAALAREHGVRVVSNEIHAPLVLPGAVFTPFLSVPGAENAFALVSASKAWNLAGLKAALAVAGSEAAAELRLLPEEVSHGPSHLGVIAHTAAFRAGGSWLDELLLGLDANRRLLGQLLDEHLPDVRYQRPEGTYLAWLDCTWLGLHDERQGTEGPGVVSDLAGPARMFLDEARVALSSGHVFGSGGEGYVRLNFATTPAVLRQAVTGMGRAVRALRQ